MFDSPVPSLAADLAVLLEVATRVALRIGPDMSGAAAAEALDELIAAGRQLGLATVKVVGHLRPGRVRFGGGVCAGSGE
jgi:hypothetical protein